MSIVGTRPPLISETNLYEPHHKAFIKKLRRVRNQLITLLPPSTRWAVVAYIENFVFFLFILDFIWKRLLICSDAWAENIPGGEYDLVKLPLPGSCGRVSFFYSEAL